MNTNFDTLVEFTLLPTKDGGRQKPVFNKYRPHHKVNGESLTSGAIEFIDVDTLHPGESTKAFVTFIAPEYYPNTLKVGQIVDVHEGSRKVGFTKILEIYNKVMLTE